jgi:hypothetical protein
VQSQLPTVGFTYLSLSLPPPVVLLPSVLLAVLVSEIQLIQNGCTSGQMNKWWWSGMERDSVYPHLLTEGEREREREGERGGGSCL